MKEYAIVGLSVVFFILICLGDALVESAVFSEKPFWSSVVLDVSGHALFLRSLVTVCFLIFGAVVFQACRRQKRTEQALEERSAKLAESNSALEREIAERNHLEADLRASEEWYRTVADFAHDWESWTDPSGHLLWVSPSCKDLTGYSAEEFLSDPSLETRIVHAEDRGAFEKHLCETLNGVDDAPHSLDFRIIRRDGEARWINHVCRPVPGKEGKTLGRRSSNRDITYRRQAEDALRDSEEKCRCLYEESKRAEERYRSLLNSSPDAIVIYDMNGDAQYLNASFVKTFGWTLEDVRGKRIPFVPESERENTVAAVRRVVDDGEGVGGFESKRYTKGGDLLDVRLSASRYHDLTGRPAGMLVILRDITASKRAEEETRRTKSLLTTIIQHLPTPVVLKDASELSYVMWNAASEELYGYSSTEVLGKTAHDFFPKAQADTFDSQDREALASGRLICIADQLVDTKHKGPRVLNIKKLPIPDEKGEPQYLLGISEDITERKEAERDLIAAREAAEEASRAKTEFLANMSHEIRTPMNGIMGMTELTLSTDLTPEQYEYLDAVRTSADALLKLINDILDFSKVEAGKMELINVEFSVRDSIADIMTLLAVDAHSKNLELLYDIPPEIPDAVTGDPGRIRQILTNLVGNAIKFTNEGEVVVRVESALEKEDKVCLHLTVADTGIGIPPEKREKIFRAFEQADGSTSRKYGGTGLGLAIASRFCTMMGGKIWVESEVGRGSTFHVTLRLSLQSGRVTQPVIEDISRLKDLPILVVDDNATNRKILEQVLHYWGMKPSAVDGGAAALSEMRKARQAGSAFPVVITDCMMPGMDGFELVERVRQDPDLAASIIIMLTSSGQRGDAARCLKLGIAAYLLKPVKHTELLFTLSRVLDAAQPDQSRPALITRHSIRESKRRLNVLVVEDNAVNRKLATRMLERMGHTVTVAGDGVAALEILERERFDLVVMDVQMPRMDGLAATRAFRTREKVLGAHLPIIAMTAYAMEGDKEACLQAGMDGYVSKPVKAQELHEAIEQVLSGLERDSQQVPMPSPSAPVLDRAAILDRVGGDTQLLNEVIGLFVDDCPTLLGEIREAFQQGDPARLEQAAHTLKGSVSNFAAPAAVQAALRLETIGRSRELKEAPEAIMQLEREIDWVRTELIALDKEAQP